MCTGSNTEFYRDRRHAQRARDRNNLRALLAHYHIDEVSDLWLDDKIPKRDTWEEPTDGSWPVFKSQLEALSKQYGEEYTKRKIKPKFK